MSTLTAILDEHVAVAQRSRASLLEDIGALAADLVETLERGGKLVTFGNGGSAADAQHFAAELTGHFLGEREPLPAVALTVDSSALTAIANDYGYDHVFERQATALCGPADLVVGISTSGGAASVANGVSAARARGARTWALTGGNGGRLLPLADRSIVVPSAETARIQEMHILVIHAVCARGRCVVGGRWPAGIGGVTEASASITDLVAEGILDAELAALVWLLDGRGCAADGDRRRFAGGSDAGGPCGARGASRDTLGPHRRRPGASEPRDPRGTPPGRGAGGRDTRGVRPADGTGAAVRAS